MVPFREWLRYDPLTGVFVWKKSVGSVKAGRIAGYIEPNGYRVIGFSGGSEKAHIIAWLLMYGTIPAGLEIDHKNGQRHDNRISNLRLATHRQNMANSRSRQNNTSGFKGVSLFKPTGRWMAYIVVNYKRIYLGYFSHAEDAARAYDDAAREHFGEFARTNF